MSFSRGQSPFDGAARFANDAEIANVAGAAKIAGAAKFTGIVGVGSANEAAEIAGMEAAETRERSA